MLDRPIINLARPVKALAPSDSVARAAGLLRAVNVKALPVVDNGRVIGVVTEESALRLLTEAMRGGLDSDSAAASTTIAGGIQGQSVFAHRDMTIGQVADLFNSTDEDVLPIVDDFGGFYGIVSRTDLLNYLSGSLRPANVAGMATPLGVYLTNGSVRAGAGDFGLFLSGIALGMNVLMAWLIVWVLAFGVGKLTGAPVVAMLNTPSVAPSAKWLFAMQWMPPVMVIGLIMLIIRMSPLSGYHAAEHMTVHALEVGEELTPENVKYMPRVHARCGTNLLAAASVFIVITGSFSGDLAVLLAIMVVIIGWRNVGGYLQRVATTKTPTRKQLENGVRVGRELVAKFQDQPNYTAYGFARIWNIGLLQSMAGLGCVFGLVALVSKIFGVNLPF
jgi:CBS domain-containing protein